MKSRTIEIMQILALQRSNRLNVSDVSRQYAVSERTIFNDIKEINTVLEFLRQPLLTVDSNGEIFVDPSLDVLAVNDYFKSVDSYFYRLSAYERRHLLLLKLLTSTQPIQLSDFENDLSVSRTTVYYDLTQIRNDYHDLNVTINNEPGIGLSIFCDEKDARKIIFHILNEDISSVSKKTVFENMLISILYRGISFDSITDAVRVAETTVSRELSDSDFDKCLMYFYTTANRISLNKTLLNSDSEEINFDSEANVRIQFVRSVFQVLGISSLVELQSAIKFVSELDSLKDIRDSYTVDLLTTVVKLLYKMSEIINVTLYQDPNIMALLAGHLRRLMMQSSEETAYPANLESIKSEMLPQYIPVFDAVKNNIELIEKLVGHSLNDTQLFTIVVYICAIIEKQSSRFSNINVVISSPGSMAMGQMLAAQVSNQFNFNICGIYDRRHIEERKLSGVDFIISTKDLENIATPVIIVSGMINIKDSYRLLNIASRLSGATKTAGFNSSNSILLSILDEASLFPNASATNWEETIRLGGNSLVRKGDVSVEYIDKIISIIHEFGPYFAVMPGMIYAHAAPENGVVNPAMSLVIVPSGVDFGSKEFDPIRFIFIVSEIEATRYFELFKEISMIMESAKTCKKMLAAESSSALYSVIKEFYSDLT